MAGLAAVTGPDWWNERRYGMFLHANIATVPSFSPIGEHADWYRSHLGEVPARSSRGAHASPLAEVLAYHRDRWSHVEQYDDFLPFLSFHRFDADHVVELALAAGMEFLIQTTKHHDGFCWWDAPNTERTSLRHGPQRDIVAEVSTACRRSDVVYGTQYSLLDWSELHRPPSEYADGILHPHVLDLVERYGTELLWGDGFDCGLDGTTLRTNELIDRAQDLADLQGFELAVNDGWVLAGSAADSVFSTFRHRPPTDIRVTPWALRTSLGPSPSFNRAERAEHLLSTGALFELLTEVVAKGGNLLVDVSPGVDGTIGEMHQDVLREVGAWVNEHTEFVNGSRPFDQWGDAQVRYVTAGDDVLALDLTAGGAVVLAGLTPDRYEVCAVVADDGGAVHWEQHNGGVTINRIDRSPTGLAGLYRINLVQANEAIRLFEERDDAPRPVQPMLDSATKGGIVQLGEGTYAGGFVIPEGVTVRGMGWDRTSIVGDVRLDDDARLEGVNVTGPSGQVRVDGCGVAVVGCRCDGIVVVRGHDAQIRSLIGRGIQISGERAAVDRCSLKGSLDDVGIDADGGFGHRIVGNELVDHLCSIRLSDSSTSTVAENRCAARWWGIHLVRCDHIEVIDNSIRNTMRAVDVNGGNGTVISKNWVADGDSGALIEFGATDTSVIDNHIARCRIGVLMWDAPTTTIGTNEFVDIHEEEPCVRGPDSDT